MNWLDQGDSPSETDRSVGHCLISLVKAVFRGLYLSSAYFFSLAVSSLYENNNTPVTHTKLHYRLVMHSVAQVTGCLARAGWMDRQVLKLA